MTVSEEFQRVVRDLAVELFGENVAVIEPGHVTVQAGHDLGMMDADLVVVVPEGHATLVDELALADAVETSQPGVQPVIRLVSREMIQPKTGTVSTAEAE